MATATATRICSSCKEEFEFVPGKGRPPLRCSDCRGGSRAKSNGVAESGGGGIDDSVAETPSAHDVIEQFGLDYNLGTAVRFILEKDDGDERANLEAAQQYLERAVARLTPTS